mmetsp:Transcript_56722/g.109538  ORF Transcript_56722/g.109538 Transcript_56722/m.109538 type:complete len:98 (-) Transcript_56722:2-295(-)
MVGQCHYHRQEHQLCRCLQVLNSHQSPPGPPGRTKEEATLPTRQSTTAAEACELDAAVSCTYADIRRRATTAGAAVSAIVPTTAIGSNRIGTQNAKT